jgi:hypothetical protein
MKERINKLFKKLIGRFSDFIYLKIYNCSWSPDYLYLSKSYIDCIYKMAKREVGRNKKKENNKIRKLFKSIKYKIDKYKYDYEIIVIVRNTVNGKIDKIKYKCNYYYWEKEDNKSWLILSSFFPYNNHMSKYIYKNKYLKIKGENIITIEIKGTKKENETKEYMDFTKAINNELLEEDFKENIINM